MKPTHPGAILREDVIPALGVTKAEFADALGISRQMLYLILSEQSSITVEMAVRIGYVLSTGPHVWLNMQRKYDLWRINGND